MPLEKTIFANADVRTPHAKFRPDPLKTGWLRGTKNRQTDRKIQFYVLDSHNI